MEKEKEKEIYELLLELGVPTNFRGFDLLMEGILEFEKNNNLIYETGKFYKTLAQKKGKTCSQVERNIRYAVEISYKNGNIDLLNKILGYTVAHTKYKPNNALYIASIVRYLQYNKKEA